MAAGPKRCVIIFIRSYRWCQLPKAGHYLASQISATTIISCFWEVWFQRWDLPQKTKISTNKTLTCQKVPTSESSPPPQNVSCPASHSTRTWAIFIVCSLEWSACISMSPVMWQLQHSTWNSCDQPYVTWSTRFVSFPTHSNHPLTLIHRIKWVLK